VEAYHINKSLYVGISFRRKPCFIALFHVAQMLEILVFYLLAVMALITIVGFPCSGKSRLAEALVKDLKAHLSHPDYSGPNLDVVLVSDDTSHVSRSVYDSESLY